MPEPIVILGFPRTGTSLVAGIFHRHGAWVGNSLKASPANPKGFFENVAAKRALVRLSGADLRREYAPDPKIWRREIEDVLDREGYESGPWLVKHVPTYHRAWREFTPHFVKVRRRKESTLKSCTQTGWFPYTNDEMSAAYDLHNRIMDQQVFGVDVPADELVRGDFTAIKCAIEQCGLAYREDVVRESVDPGLWD